MTETIPPPPRKSLSFGPPDLAQGPTPAKTEAGATPLPPHLQSLARQAQTLAKAASADNTQRAYASDWRQFARWCRRQGFDEAQADPRVVGLYIAACANERPPGRSSPLAVSTIERRLSAIGWHWTQSGQSFDRADRHVATVLAGLRRVQGRPPLQKEAVLTDDLLRMVATLDLGSLRGLRDRAILLVGFAGGLRRSEIVALDCGRDQSDDGRGWIEILANGLVVTLRGKTGWREVEIGCGTTDQSCPVQAVQTWLAMARVSHGPVFRRVTGNGKAVGPDRLDDRHVARLVKTTASVAGLRADLPETQRQALFSGHSLRAGLASSAEVDERYVQKQLGHASAEMTRRYQRRRDRFRVNLTKAAGL